MSAFDVVLGKRLKDVRQGHGLNQEQLSKLIGVSRSTISQIENGKRSVTAQDLSKIADALGISIDSFLDPERGIDVVLETERSRGKKGQQVRISVPQKNLRKFKEVLLYILEQVGSRPNVGETVIYKLLYFIDFDFYEKYEEQLIGASYIKNKYGPTPVEFAKIVQKMVESKELDKVASKYYNFMQTKYLPMREPDLQILKASELKTIDEVLCRLAHMDASAISAYSHKDIPWLTTDSGGIIEYESVFYRSSPYSQRNYEESVQ
jgi:transcriptional regulator with XRE-family HTH domain